MKQNKIKINGKNETLEKEISIWDFLKNKKINVQDIVVELNGEIIKTKNYKKKKIKVGNKVEILSFVGGG